MTLEATFRQPFPEQVAAFRLRLGDLVPTSTWTDLWTAQHDRAFMVAGATKADLLADLAGAVDRAIAEGTSLEEFRRDFRKIVADRGWTGWTGSETEAGRAWRTRVIYKTNVRVSYAAGRWAQLRNFPLWIYRHGGSQEPRPHHLALDQVVVPREHPFWLTHYPPNGWGCSCYVTGARSAEAARRRGGDPDKALPDGWNTIDPKTAAPVGIDRGWDYAPGASVSDTIALGAEKIRSLPPQIGGALGGAMDALIDKYWPMWLSDAELRARREITLVGAIEPALIEALRRRGRAPASAEILIKPGVVAGPKADRHKRHGDALSDQDWLGLPGLLRAPDAVLLDKQTGAVIFVRRNQVGGTQITISVDYRFRKSRETRLGNVVVSAYRPTLETLKNRIKAGMLEVVFGRLG